MQKRKQKSIESHHLEVKSCLNLCFNMYISQFFLHFVNFKIAGSFSLSEKISIPRLIEKRKRVV